jgi:transposase
MISSLRFDGSTACLILEGATDSEVFRTYVEKVLVPTLQPGDIVVMDNLAPHKDPQALALIAQAGAKALFLPAYPDLNPIEKMWSKVKNRLRSLAARTAEELQTAIATALSEVTAKDAASWFASCGYSFI